MIDLGSSLAAALLKTTLVTSIAAVLVWIVLDKLRITSPRIHCLAWLCVIFQAWVLFPWTVQIQIATQPPSNAPVAIEPLHPDAAPLTSMPVGPISRPHSQQRGDASTSFDRAKKDVDHVAAPYQLSQNASPHLLARPILWLWISGCMFFLASHFARYVRFCRLVPLGSVPHGKWADEWNELLEELNQRSVRKNVHLRMTDQLGPLLCYIPFTFLVLVPIRLWEVLDRSKRMAILRHELAHRVRGDLWKSIAVRLLALPQWFNPLVWWAVRRFDEAAEWACDDLAKGQRNEQHVSYASALLRMSELVMEPQPATVAAQGGRLSRRVNRLVNSRFKEESTMRKRCFYLFLLALTAAHAVRVELVAEPTPVDRLHDVSYSVGDLVRANLSSDESWELNSLMDEIASMMSMIAPGSWHDPGGRQSITAFKHDMTLVVSQTESVHKQLIKFLEAKRQRLSQLRESGFYPYRIEPPDVLSVTVVRAEPDESYELGPKDTVQIAATSTSEEHNIIGRFEVRTDGRVELNEHIGVTLSGLTRKQAEKVICDKLTRRGVPSPTVSVTPVQLADNVDDEHLVNADGKIHLGRFGRCYLAGLTLEEARQKIEKQLSKWLTDVEITVNVAQMNSKNAYIIYKSTDGIGDNVIQLPVTGKETVLDATGALDDIPKLVIESIHIGRPAPNGIGTEQILAVDWDAVSAGTEMATNYLLLPGDRIFIYPQDRIQPLGTSTERLNGMDQPDVDSPSGNYSNSTVSDAGFSATEQKLTQLAAGLQRELRKLDTVRNRQIAAERELHTIEEVYDTGRVSLDQLLDAQARLYQANVDYGKSLVAISTASGGLDAAKEKRLIATLKLKYAKDARDKALELWKSVKTLHDTGSAGGSASREAQARQQYFAFRSETEDALSELNDQFKPAPPPTPYSASNDGFR